MSESTHSIFQVPIRAQKCRLLFQYISCSTFIGKVLVTVNRWQVFSRPPIAACCFHPLATPSRTAREEYHPLQLILFQCRTRSKRSENLSGCSMYYSADSFIVLCSEGTVLKNDCFGLILELMIIKCFFSNLLVVYLCSCDYSVTFLQP